METPLATTQTQEESIGRTHSQKSDPFDFVESNHTECQNIPKRFAPRPSMDSSEVATVAFDDPGGLVGMEIYLYWEYFKCSETHTNSILMSLNMKSN